MRTSRTPAWTLAAAIAVVGMSGTAFVRQGSPSERRYVHRSQWPMPYILPVAPVDLALGADNDALYVVDGLNNNLQVFDRAGLRISAIERHWGAPSTAQPLTPLAVETDPIDVHVDVVWGETEPSGGAEGPGAISRKFRERLASEPSFLVPLGNQGAYVDMAPQLFNHRGEWPHVLLFRRGDMSLEVDPRGLFGGSWEIPATGGWPRLAVGADGRTALATGNEEGLRVYDAAGQLTGTITLQGRVPLAPVVDAAGMLNVLVREKGLRAGLAVVSMDWDGTIHAVRRLEGLRAPPSISWPWALAVSDRGFAVTAASTVFEIHWFDVVGTPIATVYGTRVMPRYVPGATYSPRHERPGSPSSIAISREHLFAADTVGAQVVAFDAVPPGAPATQGRVAMPGTALWDLDAAGDEVIGLQVNHSVVLWSGGPDSLHTEWSTPCNCDAFSRVAVAPTSIYVTAPDERRITRLSRQDGTSMSTIVLGANLETSPTDIAVSDAGRLFTAEEDQRVHEWSSAGVEIGAWRAGGAAGGPWRLAVSNVDNLPTVAVLTGDGAVELYDASGVSLAQWRPLDEAGEAVYAEDIAIDTSGRVFLADASGWIHVYEEAEPTGSPTRTVTPSPTPDQARSCQVTGDKWVAPSRVVLGETTTLTLTLSARCPGDRQWTGADVVVALDTSGSMAGAKLETAQRLVRGIGTSGLSDPHRLGLVTIGETATLEVGLSASPDAVLRKLPSMGASGRTAIGQGLSLAASHLAAVGRESAMPTVILVSDGLENVGPMARTVAADVQQGGVVIFSVGVGDDIDATLLTAVATGASHVYLNPTVAGVRDLVRLVEALGLGATAHAWDILDIMGDEIGYVPGSVQPAAVESPGRLEWYRPVLPQAGMTLTYRIRPLEVGLWPTNRQAHADYRDGDSALRRFQFPVPSIEVLAPTPTPTPQPRYIPLALREAPCERETLSADVVLVIDASTSMLEEIVSGSTKLAVASQASSSFVELLSSGDQAAIAWFNEVAELEQPLTDDKSRLLAAISRIPARHFTRIDLGIQTAREELSSARRKPGNRPVMLVLTDGKANPVGPDAAVAQGQRAKAAGITIFTIGLGAPENLDDWALRQIASRREYYYQTPDAEGLITIYEEIAGVIPCPRERYWGRR